jgi:hypothetical protein
MLSLFEFVLSWLCKIKNFPFDNILIFEPGDFRKLLPSCRSTKFNVDEEIKIDTLLKNNPFIASILFLSKNGKPISTVLE